MFSCTQTLEQVKGQYQVDSYSKSVFALPQPPSYPSPSPTPLMTPVTPGSASSVGVNRNGNFPTPPPSETTSNHIQNGNFSFTPANHGSGGGGSRAVVKGEELDLNLDNLDFEALAAVANALPSPRSLSATRSTSSCETAASTHPPATSHSTSCSLQPTLAAEPPTLPPTLSSPSLSLPAGSSSSSSPFISSSGSHTTDLAWSQQQNWPSYLMKQADAGASGLTNGPPFQTASSVPSFLQHPTTPRNLPQPQMSLPAQSVSVPHPHPSAPVRSLSLTTGERERSAPRKRRSNSSSNSKSRRRRPSQTGVCNSQPPKPLLAEQPSLAGFSGVKTETMIGFPPPLPPGLASHPSLLSQLQSASNSTSSLPTPVSLPGGGFNSSLSHLTSGGLTNISSFDVFPHLPSPLSGPSVGLIPGTNVNQTVPLSTTVGTTGRTGTDMTPTINATPNSTVTDANGFFVNSPMLPLSTAGLPNYSFSTSGQDLNPTTRPPHDEKLALKKPRISPANESCNTSFSSSTSLSSGAHPVAVAVGESVLTQELIPTSQDHHLQLAESTHPPPSSQPLLPPSFSQPPPSSSSSSLPLSSYQLSAPTSASSSLVDQLLEALQEKQSGVGGGKGDCSPSESSSGISSAGTNASAFFPSSTAESSPVDAHSLMTSSAPLSPSLISSHPLPLHHISTSSHSDGRAADSPQLFPSGPSPRGGPDQNTIKTEPLLFGSNQNSSRGAPESETAGSDSDLIFPQVPFPSLASLKEYMILEPELRPPKQPPFQPGMELRPDCPVYEVCKCAAHIYPCYVCILEHLITDTLNEGKS